MSKDKSTRKLTTLPGVGKSRAKALEGAGFKTLDDIAAANREDLAQVGGMGLALADNVIKAAKEAIGAEKPKEEADSWWSSGKSSLFICPACGSLASSGAASCPKCGVHFEEGDEVELPLETEPDKIEEKAHDGFWYKDEAKLFLCPSCGSLAAADAQKCPSCGAVFEPDEKTVDIPLVPLETKKEDAEDGFWYKDEAKLFLCPSCGSLAAAGSKGCPRCGAHFVEEEAVEMPLEMETQQTTSGPEVKDKGDVDGHWYKAGASLFLCPGCGSLAAAGSKLCPKCGVEFVDDEQVELPLIEKTEPGADAGKDVDGFWYKDKKSLFICPGCGSLAAEGADKCPSCGAVFEPDDGVEMPLVEKAPAEKEEEPVELYLCPDCGAFLSEKASRCQACGADFSQTEIARPAPEINIPEPSPPLCPDCGKPITAAGAACPACHPAGKTCKTCGDGYEGEGEYCNVCGALEYAIGMGGKTAPAARERTRESSRLVEVLAKNELERGCEVCGKRVKEGESLCLDCRISKLTAKLDGKVPDTSRQDTSSKRRGISKDFIQRWSGMGAPEAEVTATTKPVTKKVEKETLPGEAKPEPNSEEPKTSDDWFQRGVSMMASEQLDEAMHCFDKAAELSPERETDYRARALELIAKMRDAGGAVDEEEMSRDLENLDARFWFIEESLKNDPKNDRLWQERGELLQKRGQSAEATRSFHEAIRLSYERISELTEPATAAVMPGQQPKSRVSSTPQGQRGKPVGGMVNGLARGRTNGRVNGMVNGRGKTNGRINGLVNGRGRTNGRINGLVNGRGKVNGLVNGLGYSGGLTNGQGLVNGAGLVNGIGLINGTGFINGTAPAPYRRRDEQRNQWHWMAGLMALAVALMMFSPMLDLGKPRATTLSVDGYFGDWENVAGYRNALTPASANADVVIDQIKLGYENQKLFVYASVRGSALAGQHTPELNSTASMYAFIDADRNALTGYSIGSIGADYLLDVSGWRGDGGAVLRAFDRSKNRTNWLGFDSGAAANVAVSNSEVEVEAFLPSNATSPLVLVCTSDGSGYQDMAESPVSPGLAVAKAFERGPESESLSEPGVLEVQRVTVHSSGGASSIMGLELTRIGNAPDATSVSSIAAIRAGGAIEPLAFTQSQSNAILGITFALPLALAEDEVVNITIAGSAGQGAVLPNTTGLTLSRIVRAEAGDVHISKLAPSTISLGLWTDVHIDGAFADWNGVPKSPDSLGDVTTTLGNGLLENRNVDLVSSALLDSGEFFVQVSGTALGGSAFPRYSIRREGGSPAPAPDWNASDNDMDGVPNGQDPMPFDFDNDGVNDAMEDGDKDGDGLVEYPYGPDLWLNATTPVDFPAPFANVSSGVYVGPVTERERERLGEDSLLLWIDSDGNASTGARVPGGLGADHALVVTGRGGIVLGTSLAAYDPGQGRIPWRETDPDVPVGNDLWRFEGRLPQWLVGPQTAVTVEMRDSDGSSDVSDGALSTSVFVSQTRSPAGDNVVINEIVVLPNNGEWIELCNPTSSPINIGGWRLRMGSSNLFVFPANTILGAFGSGTEYYAATFYGNGNELPNGGATILLQVAGTWATVDSFTYGALLAGQSWARFKNATWGMPMDTDTVGDYYISDSPTFRAPNDRTAPMIAVDKAGDRVTAPPGGAIVYTIYYNNTGDGNARHVWVNDTLPAGTTYSASSVPYASFAGQTYRWYFNNVVPGTHSFTVSATVNAGVTSGTVLVNNVQLQYTDQLSRFLGTSTDSWTVTVQAPLPSITVKKVALSSTPSPGDYVDFTIYYNNTGDGTASNVWLNDTLPVGMSYVSATPPPATVAGQNVFWSFLNVAPGNYQVTLSAQVGAGVAPGTILTNLVTCAFKDSAGVSLPPTVSQVSVTVASPASRIVINELAARPNPEWVELCNPTSSAINIGGWRIYSGNQLRYTFPVGTAIGAWGSGSEYLVATMTQNNRFPDAGGVVRLTTGTGAEIDRSNYPATVNGQTWSRFKDVETGQPVDTNNDANDFYISNNGWVVPEGPTRGAPNDRSRPVMAIEKSSNAPEGAPRDLVTFTLWYNNTGDGNAKNVWLNDTLPTGMTYAGASVAPSSINGQLLTWYFANVIHDTVNSLSVSATIDLSVVDGSVLTNSASLAYSDQLRRPMASSSDAVAVTCVRPQITVVKIADLSIAAPGDDVTYTIHYNNTGSRNAAHVWLNDTLPVGMTYVSSSTPYVSVAGQTYGWYFTSVAPGAHFLTLVAHIPSSTPVGTALINVAALAYTDQSSRQLPSSSSAWTIVVSAPSPSIAVAKVVDVPTPSPGDDITYTIHYNNTGSGEAGHVWLNDTLPVGTTFVSSSVLPNATSGQVQYWHFVAVAPGNHFITVQAQIGSAVPLGTVLTNTVTGDYKNLAGSSLPRTTAQASVVVTDPLSRIVINEISVQGDTNEWVEVCNPTGSPVDVSGWRIRVGFFSTAYTFPAGTVLGAWGSGSEYFVANTGGGNDFPNGGSRVRLQRQTGFFWTTIDETNYPGGILATQTWSRFKHEDTGYPLDTGVDSNDFYISNNGWLVPEGPTPAAPNDRKRPVMSVEKTASLAEAAPGDIVTFTLWYNNTGDGNAKRVWLNDTLPAGMTYVSASVAPAAVSGQLLTWYFANVIHDSVNSIALFATIAPTVADGTVLTNVANLAYSDQLQRPMTPSSDTAIVTCRRPQITVAKVADVTDVQAGGLITYTIWYNNTGSRNAGDVWINDTLPIGVTYLSASVPPSSSSGLTYSWHFTNVAPSAYSFTITVQVNATCPSGIISNLVDLNYTTSNGWSLPGSSDLAMVVVPEFGDFAVPTLTILASLMVLIRIRRKIQF
ncbi:MAG: lamin tail domain-containing protein [Methanobacteriota archaeon]